jgi:protein-L-isoaspartate O-methyltransferase
MYDRDVPYVPTPENVVAEMLRLARPTRQDVVYDLGSGDGRILIAAAKKYGARGVGVEIDRKLVRKARGNAEKAGVGHLITFREGDLFQTDLRGATIVTLYLLPSVNLRLRPKLFQELAPGTRIVSHNYDMGDWRPKQTLKLGDHFVYFWTISGLEKSRK